MGKKYPAIFFCVIITLTVGLLAGMISRPDEWYYALNKPVWNPPDWLFAPVWVLLYVLMGVAAGLTWVKRDNALAKMSLILYIIQLILNVSWPVIFFRMHNPGLAFAEICLLLAVLLATIFNFWRVSRSAGILLLPYFLWVSFASVLNFAIWRINIGVV